MFALVFGALFSMYSKLMALDSAVEAVNKSIITILSISRVSNGIGDRVYRRIDVEVY